jgi:hypothetical protein
LGNVNESQITTLRILRKYNNYVKSNLNLNRIFVTIHGIFYFVIEKLKREYLQINKCRDAMPCVSLFDQKSALADGKSELILIIVESFLSLPSATRPFGERRFAETVKIRFEKFY